VTEVSATLWVPFSFFKITEVKPLHIEISRAFYNRRIFNTISILFGTKTILFPSIHLPNTDPKLTSNLQFTLWGLTFIFVSDLQVLTTKETEKIIRLDWPPMSIENSKLLNGLFHIVFNIYRDTFWGIEHQKKLYQRNNIFKFCFIFLLLIILLYLLLKYC